MTIIYSNFGDRDTGLLQAIWQGLHVDRYIVICHDDENYEDIIYKVRNDKDKAKVHRMTEYLQKYKHYDSVPDPYYEGPDGFELVLDLLEDGCQGLLDACLHL